MPQGSRGLAQPGHLDRLRDGNWSVRPSISWSSGYDQCHRLTDPKPRAEAHVPGAFATYRRPAKSCSRVLHPCCSQVTSRSTGGPTWLGKLDACVYQVPLGSTWHVQCRQGSHSLGAGTGKGQAVATEAAPEGLDCKG